MQQLFVYSHPCNQLDLPLGLCRFQEEWAEVITGEQEGLYGWIALNYLTGRLRAHPLAPSANETLDQPHPSAPSAPHDGPGKGPAGALDLGGSSLEITYPMQEDQEDLAGAQGDVVASTLCTCTVEAISEKPRMAVQSRLSNLFCWA